MSAESLNNFCAIAYIWNVLRCPSGPESFYISKSTISKMETIDTNHAIYAKTARCYQHRTAFT